MESIDSLATMESLTNRISQPLWQDSKAKFLRFSLGCQDSGLLLLAEVSEVLGVTVADILSVPEMPSCVLGIYNWRGKMLWLVDLAHLVDYPPLSWQGRDLVSAMAIVIQMNGQSIGLVVQHVFDIELHDAEQLESAAGLFPPRLLPFVKGYLPSANSAVLDPEAIARFPMWQVHRS